MGRLKINKRLKVGIIILLIVVFGAKIHLLHKKHVEYKRIKKPTQSKKVKVYKKFTVNKKKEITFNENDLSQYHNILKSIKDKQDYQVQENIKQYNRAYDERQAELRRQEELRKQEEERKRQKQIQQQQEIQRQKEIEKQKAQENKQINNAEVNRGGDNQQGQEINIICSAYTSDPSENGSGLGITAKGTKLRSGICAIPREFALGTKIYVQGLDSFIGINELSGEDYGNSSYVRRIDNNTIKIDVFMSSKQQALNFGIRKFKGYIINN